MEMKRLLYVLMVVIMLFSCMTIGMTALAGNDATDDIGVAAEKKSSPSVKSVQAYSSEGDFYYEVEDGEAIITDYNGDGGDVVIPSSLGGYSVTTIGDSAFEYCYNLTSVTIGNSVTTIGDYAFYSCDSLTSVSIGNGVTTIENYAFSDCDSLTSITIPDSITTIGAHAFYWCSSLTSITIPDSVTNIEGSAFSNCDSLTSITIPDSVTTIGARAFLSCDSLTSVTIPANVTTIGEMAFSYCYSLASVTIGNSVTTIRDGAFNDCTNLTNVYYNGHEEKWNSIEIQLGNESLTEATIYFCEGVTRTFLAQVPTCTENGYTEGVYCDDCDSWISGHDVIPATHTDENADNICDLCGQNTSDIAVDERKTIEINADEITYLKFIPETSGVYTFYSISDDDTYGYLFDANKEELEHDDDDGEDTNFSLSCYLEAGETYYWGTRYYDRQAGSFDVMLVFGETSDPDEGWDDDEDENEFSYSVNEDGETITITGYRGYEEELIIPDMLDGYSVTIIGEGAFEFSDDITSITIPDSVTSIGEDAFYSCDSLTSVIIGNGVTSIGDYAFSNCDSLAEIIVDSENEYYSSDESGVLFNKDKTELVQYPIGNERTSYEIPDSVTTIGNYAFDSCDSLTSIIIPDSVTTIGNSAFSDCDSLTSVTIPDSVTTIGDSAFSSCDSLTSTTIPDSVTTIGDYAFYFCISLTSITIPDSVTTIGEWTFYGCTSLTSVTIGNGVTTIGGYAFSNCDSLTSITFPDSVTTIGGQAFSWCDSLVSVIIGNGVTTIGGQAFFNCDSLTEIIVDSENKYYSNDESGVLFNKDKTELIQYTNGKETISYVIPNGVTYIKERAFESCYNLTSITIPDSVTTIEEYAFAWCDNLADVYYSGTEEQWNNIEIVEYGNDCLTSAEIHFNYVPEHTHSHMLTSTTPATCTVDGSKTFTCSCGNSYTEIIPATGHTLTDLPAKAATCSATGLTVGKKCSVCGTVTVKQNTVAKKAHTYKDTVTKATLSANGKTVTACTVCKTVSKTVTIAKPSTIKLSKTTYTYTGKAITPTVTVKDSAGKTLKKDTDYTVTYSSGRKSTGKYTVTVTFKGKYSGTKKLTFNILPKATSKVTATQTTTSVKAKWSKVTGASGYKVELLNSKGKALKTATTTKLEYNFTKLSKGTTYKVKVTAYKTIDGKKVYSTSSKTLTTATKPAKVTLSKVTAGSKQATLNWKTVTGATGYEIVYSTSKDFKKSKKTATIKKQSTKKTTIKKLTKGKTYYFKVRAYKTVDGKKIYSAYSSVKSVKIK